MKRAEIKRRTPLRSKAPPPRPVKTLETYTPKPRAVAVAVADTRARMVVPVPKFAYVRDERLREMCRAMRCQHCNMGGADAGVTWAHSNQGIHGKAGAIKASDVYVAALCWWCHREVDQGGRLSQDEKVAMWTAAHMKTIAEAVRLGLWPKDIPRPGYEVEKTCHHE